MSRERYPTDLSDAEWSLLEPHLPVPKRRGRPRVHSPREILNAVFHVLKSGCQWRMLPREFPPWKTVFHYFRTWRIDGTWERMNRTMRRRLREELGRDPEPSAGIVDSQSVKTTGVGGEQRGFDGGKNLQSIVVAYEAPLGNMELVRGFSTAGVHAFCFLMKKLA